MEKQRMARLAAILVVAIMSLVFIAMYVADLQLNSQNMRISLPTASVAGGTAGDTQVRPEQNINEPQSVEISPDNVQNVIKTMSRPSAYSMEAVVENLYDENTLTTNIKYYLLNGYSRTEKTTEDEEAYIIITGEDNTFIWQNGDTKYYHGVEGEFDGDSASGIPTYEDILTLDPGMIRDAEYRNLDGENCIYIRTYDELLGYSDSYWVSLSSGLLIQAESSLEETVLYRITVKALKLETPPDTVLLLPTNVSVKDAA